jgi:hypothetical protein
MSEDRRQILEMLAQGKISAAEAEKLIAALENSTPSAGEAPGRTPKYLRILVESQNNNKVNVRVPIQLLRAGVKLAGLIPMQAREKVTEALSENGIQVDLKSLKPSDLDDLIDQMNELTVDVDDGNERVRVFCE